MEPPYFAFLRCHKKQKNFCLLGNFKELHSIYLLNMPSPKCLYINSCVYMIGFRTERDLPFTSLSLINEIIWSCIARAQQLYPVEIITFTLEPNHVHLLIRCINPEDIPRFIGYIKQESAHAINRLVGRRRNTIWVEGYDKPIILDYRKFLDCFAYATLNPYKDQLVPDMKEFKGVSTWALFKEDISVRSCRLISRSSVTKLHNPHEPWRENDMKLQELYRVNKQEIAVELNFYSWKKCFKETEGLSDMEVRKLMLDELLKYSEEIKKSFTPKSKYPDLSKQSLLKEYSPRKFGKKTICLSFFKDLRIDFINFYKDKVHKAKEVFERWKLGDFSMQFPSGMFAPSLPRLVNLVPQLVEL